MTGQADSGAADSAGSPGAARTVLTDGAAWSAFVAGLTALTARVERAAAG